MNVYWSDIRSMIHVRQPGRRTRVRLLQVVIILLWSSTTTTTTTTTATTTPEAE